MAAAQATLGLLDKTEVVLRGGFLKGPVVVTGLTCVGGRMYLYLSKSNNVLLSNFFSKEPARNRPLAKTLMFERIAELRDAKYKALVKDAHTVAVNVPEATGQLVVTDPCDDLGLDADPVSDLFGEATGPSVAGKPKAKANAKRRVRRKARLSVPPAAELSFNRAGQPDWTFWSLMEPANKAPAIEVTAENLQALFELVDNEISHGGVRRPQHGSSSQGLRPCPRGPPDRREYCIGSRWVIKMKKGSGEPPARVATSPKKFKTLKRRRSDDAAYSKAAATTRMPPTHGPSCSEATGQDCLDV